MSTLIRNIKTIYGLNSENLCKKSGKKMAHVEQIDNAYLHIENGIIADFGCMDELPEFKNININIDAEGKSVLPSFVDSHTHLVYAGSREIEYIDKIKGLSYEEIAKRGGGILNSAKLLQETSEEDLYRQAFARIQEIISQGTCAVEIKSGYGLTTEAELKMLRVIKRLKTDCDINIKATFLAAHALPHEYKSRQTEYVDKVINETLPKVAEENLADFIDVFCDKGFFTVEETDKILSAAEKIGLRPKIHANELDYSGGVQIACKHNALSADHLEYTGEDEIAHFKKSETMPTILPGAALFLNMVHAPARQMIDAGLPVAVASDFNPGSSPSGNMKLMMSLAMINHKMTAQECLHAATLNSAYAMNVENFTGSIKIGNQANIIITKGIPTLEFFTYAYGSSLIDTVILKGKIVAQNK